MTFKKSVFRNLISKGVLVVFNLLIPFAVMPYVYRVLDPTEVGHIEYATTIYSYFGLCGLLGIYNYGLREISQNRNSIKSTSVIYRNLFFLGLISNIFVFIIFQIFSFIFISDVKLLGIMNIMGFNLLAQAFQTDWVNEAFEDFRFITIQTIIVRLSSFIAILYFVTSNEDYLFYVIILVVTLFVSNIIGFIYALRFHTVRINNLFQDVNIKRYVKPLFIILILNNTSVLYTMLDRTMLGWGEIQEVALYSVGQRTGMMIKGLLLSIVYVTLPRMSSYLKNNRILYINNIKKLTRTMLLLTIPVSVGLCLLSQEMILLLAGDQYLDALPSFQLFSLRITIIIIEAILFNQIIFLHGKERILLIMNLFCGCLNLVLNFVFIEYLNAFNAIVTTLVAEITFQVLCLYYIKNKLGLTTGIFEIGNLKYIVLSLLFVPIIYIVRTFNDSVFMILIESICLSCLVYFFCLYFLRDVMFHDIINRVLKR